ncbi:MAG: hypothetical protein E5X63_21370 [Mesorhizobium sp.]|nr:MAG: hypothetical protein EOQ36_30150 [Mesorhizobium sp.]TIP83470.1 MAG: hypothetical protein E5X63_21370 [Mesorhizobium sp.]TJW49739.1 MAG: hypothetical protein E5X65_31855 [Mesorhizobium sp.]
MSQGSSSAFPVSFAPATVTSKSSFKKSFLSDTPVPIHHVVEPDLHRSTRFSTLRASALLASSTSSSMRLRNQVDTFYRALKIESAI